MAKPFGTRTPCDASAPTISPSDAFLPPTSATSAAPISENQRMYLGGVAMASKPRFAQALQQVVGQGQLARIR